MLRDYATPEMDFVTELKERGYSVPIEPIFYIDREGLERSCFFYNIPNQMVIDFSGEKRAFTTKIKEQDVIDLSDRFQFDKNLLLSKGLDLVRYIFNKDLDEYNKNNFYDTIKNDLLLGRPNASVKYTILSGGFSDHGYIKYFNKSVQEKFRNRIKNKKPGERFEYSINEYSLHDKKTFIQLLKAEEKEILKQAKAKSIKIHGKDIFF